MSESYPVSTSHRGARQTLPGMRSNLLSRARGFATLDGMERRVAIVLATSLAAGCGGGSGDPDAAGDAASQPDAAGGESDFAVHIFDTGQTTGLAGATVCVVGQSDCEKSPIPAVT